MLQLPPEFDLDIYTAHNPDLAGLTPEQRVAHHDTVGVDEGRISSAVSHRGAFLALVPPGMTILEIGPYTAPAFSRPVHNVRYLDAFTAAQLRAKAVATGLNPASVPEIDYVWTGQSYAELVREPLHAVFSSHNIEHQPDLIRHLQQIGSILQPGGLFMLAVPDRRYCFDHYLPDTNFADVFSAYYDRRVKHAAGAVFEHRMLTTHNEATLHWKGEHGRPPLAEPISEATIAAIAETRSRIEDTAGYIDTHAWQFTPRSFRHLVDILRLSRFIEFRIERIYPTLRNGNEFYVVLSKV